MSIRDFVIGTVSDFTEVWKLYPNVLIWCGLVGLVALIF